MFRSYVRPSRLGHDVLNTVQLVWNLERLTHIIQMFKSSSDRSFLDTRIQVKCVTRSSLLDLSTNVQKLTDADGISTISSDHHVVFTNQ